MIEDNSSSIKTSSQDSNTHPTAQEVVKLNILERQSEKYPDVTIIDFSGPITGPQGSKAMQNTIDNLIAQGKKKIVFNLAEVGYIDDHGRAELVHTLSSVNKAEGKLKLVNMRRKIRPNEMEFTGLSNAFDFYDSEDEAVEDFK